MGANARMEPGDGVPVGSPTLLILPPQPARISPPPGKNRASGGVTRATPQRKRVDPLAPLPDSGVALNSQP